MKFLDAISKWLPQRERPELDEAISRLNTDKIYVENVRKLLGITTTAAIGACEAAVRQGVFSRRIEVLTPDGKVAISANSEMDLPETVSYWHEHDNDMDEVTVRTETLPKLLSYSLR